MDLSNLSEPGNFTKPEGLPEVKTLVLTKAIVGRWNLPLCQRDLKINKKLLEVADEISETGVIPGVLTLGVVGDQVYVGDAQHRLESFKRSTVKMAWANAQIFTFSNVDQMEKALSVQYSKINTKIVPNRADDLLRSMEITNPHIALIRSACPFVGYGNFRRGHGTPLLSMSVLLRSWGGSNAEAPTSGGNTAAQLASSLSEKDAKEIVDFIGACFRSWGADPEYYRLYSALNLTILSWLYKRCVMGRQTRGARVCDQISFEQFSKAVPALTNSSYLDWLLGLQLDDRTRSPCYNRIKSLIASRLRLIENGKRFRFPMPKWASNATQNYSHDNNEVNSSDTPDLGSGGVEEFISEMDKIGTREPPTKGKRHAKHGHNGA